jgi:hypothetical protein
VQHDDDLRAPRDRFGVAGLLIRAVTEIAFVHQRLNAELASQLYGPVVAGVVDQQDPVDYLSGDLRVGLFECRLSP